MICFHIEFRAVWSSFESRVAGRRLSSPNVLSVTPRGRGVVWIMSVAGVEIASSAGKSAESAEGENR